MTRYTVGQTVLVNSALELATVTEVHPTPSVGTYYVVAFSPTDTLWRREDELTDAPQPTPTPNGEWVLADDGRTPPDSTGWNITTATASAPSSTETNETPAPAVSTPSPPQASYHTEKRRHHGTRYVAVVRYPGGTRVTIGTHRYYSPDEARKAAQRHIDATQEFT